MKTEIELLKNTDLATIFDNGLDVLLKSIETEVKTIVPNTDTKKGRDEIKSLSYTVTKSKTAIDKKAQDLIGVIDGQMQEFTDKKKLINNSRKQSNDFLKNLSKEVRQPLTDYEEDQKAEIEFLKIAKLQDEAIQLNDLFNREKIIAEKECLAEEKEEKLKLEQEQIVRDNKIREDQKAKIELAKIQAIDAEKRAIQAEKDKQEHIKQSKIKTNQLIKQSEIDKQKAVEAEQSRIEEERAESALKAKADLDNVKRKNNDALNDLILEGIDPDIAKKVVILIAQDKVSWVGINY